MSPVSCVVVAAPPTSSADAAAARYLDGSDGRFRAPLHQCLLEAKNDYEAIAAWLATKHDPNGTGRTATHRAYRKEAERLLLWAIVEHGKPLSSLTVEDVKERAAQALRWQLANGVQAVRSHVDVCDPQLRALRGLVVVLMGIEAWTPLRRLERTAFRRNLLAVGGLLTQFGLQALVHMGSSLHLLPAKGMTLPFISYGGSSLLALGIGTGMALALTRTRLPGRER